MIFSKRKIIFKAWTLMTSHLFLWMLIMFLVIGINVFLSTIQDELIGNITSRSIIFTIAAYLFQMGINLGMIQVSLNIFNQKEPAFNQIFGRFDMLIPYVFATIVFLAAILIVALPGIIILILSISRDWETITTFEFLNNATVFMPLLLIIIPAVYTSVRLQFYDYFLIEGGCTILGALINSIKITQGYVGELFILGAALSIVVLISIIPFGLGLTISIPLGIMVNTCVFKELKKFL